MVENVNAAVKTSFKINSTVPENILEQKRSNQDNKHLERQERIQDIPYLKGKSMTEDSKNRNISLNGLNEEYNPLVFVIFAFGQLKPSKSKFMPKHLDHPLVSGSSTGLKQRLCLLAQRTLAKQKKSDTSHWRVHEFIFWSIWFLRSCLMLTKKILRQAYLCVNHLYFNWVHWTKNISC